jgi:hypothetical protein
MGESDAFSHELNPDTSIGERLDEPAQVVEIAREAVHAVHDHGIALTDERQHGFKLGPVDIFARGLVGKNPVERNTVQLAIDILIECTDPDVTDPLALHRRHQPILSV